MSGSVTVPGPGGSTITQTFGNQFNQALAQNIANALAAASKASNLDIVSIGGAGVVSPAVPTAPNDGKVHELVINPGTSGNVTVAASKGWDFLVDNSLGPDTIFGSPAVSIFGSGGQHAIVDPAVIALGDVVNLNSTNATLTGAGDNVALGNGINTVTGEGTGTISGGTGTNTFILNDTAGAGTYVINSEGVNDTVFGGDGGLTINGLASVAAAGDRPSLPGSRDLLVVGGEIGGIVGTLAGSGATILGGALAGVRVTVSGGTSAVSAGGGVSASVSGSSDTIYSASSATLTGSSDKVIGGGSPLTVLDYGTSDTIIAGLGSTAITASGGSYVQGGANPLSFVGGTSGSTIIGGSGAATVFGSTGDTTLTGAAGGSFTYFNFTPATVNFAGGSGNETMDASVSKARAFMTGSTDKSGGDLLMGGAGDDVLQAGKGSDTLIGGGGHNTFDFFASNGSASAHHVLGDFSAIDMALLVNYGPSELANVFASAVTTGRATTVTLSDSTQITFTGVTNLQALANHIAVVNTQS